MLTTNPLIQRLLRLSLKWRLTLLFVAGMVGLLLILTVFIYWSTARLVMINEKHLLEQKAAAIAADLKTQLSEDKYLDADYVKQLLTNYATKQHALILLDNQNNRLASVVGPEWSSDPLVPNPDHLVVEAPIFLNASHPPLIIQVKEDNELLQPFYHILLLILTVASVGSLIISSFSGYFLAMLGLAPLSRLITHIRTIHPSKLSRRMPFYGGGRGNPRSGQRVQRPARSSGGSDETTAAVHCRCFS